MSLNEELFELLDQSVEELADLEKFEPLPAGTHLCQLTWERKDINGHGAVIGKFKVQETIEMANSNEPVPEPGKTADIAFILTRKDKETGEKVANKVGQGQLKEIVRVLQETFGGVTVSEVLEATQGASVAVTFKVRASKDDPDVKYNGIKALVAA